MNSQRIVIVGGGAAGFFAALACAETGTAAEIVILEKTTHCLSKVKISGGGRCNVTHACFDRREFAKRYPRGERELISLFQRFSAEDTIAWFARHGVDLKTENDGRMFPTTDSSQTIIDCLQNLARKAGVKLKVNCAAEAITKENGHQFKIRTTNGETIVCDKVLLATGGCRTAALGQLAASLGHTLEAPVPSLFTFHVAIPWLRDLAGVSVESAEVSIMDTNLRERGALLVTHWGLSGPAVLRLSAWGARVLHEKEYRCILLVHWLPHLNGAGLVNEFQRRRQSQPAKLVVNTPISPLPSRLWEQLVLAAGVSAETRWSALSRGSQHKLTQQLLRTEFPVSGKSLNKDEFVTCGGIRLNEVNFKTMESRKCQGLFFAGELLDIDGITGGFNFQAAWTTGWIAGHAMAETTKKA